MNCRDREWLQCQYVERRLTCKQIAAICGCAQRTINQRLVKFDIPRRNNGWGWENLKAWRERTPDWAKHSRKKRHPLSNGTKQKLSLIRRGSGNGRWKGGITAKIRGIRRSPEYYQWRKAVLARYDSTCQQCGSLEHPQAHHKLCVVDYPDKAVDIDNGTVLCEDCHKKLNFTTNRRVEK